MAKAVENARVSASARVARREELQLLIAGAGAAIIILGIFVITFLIVVREIYEWSRLWPSFVPFVVAGVIFLVAGTLLTSGQIKEMGLDRLLAGGARA